MTPAELARDNAISFECKKDALQQRQSGDWKISFTVQGIDMDERITRAPMGTRFVAVLVAINDDETPITQTAKEAMQNPDRRTASNDTRPQPSPKSPAGAKRDWRDVQPAAQAGIRCDDAIFQAFLSEEYPDVWRDCEQDAAAVVRSICKVHSRVELGTDHRKRVLWHQLDEQFLAWKALEHA